ncbi:DUF3098 domain-containing protein [Candidatus Symbiothrix dinenymphae]|uniref:DUF3098 domain-containing protein n=1 Tax=Candidatus Symbiothrix dinenymphae TaxID=467085 RepID=UPI0006C35E7D|nr:DUF3098 domain-containing protein [Candidatus Symbiothrix dinenymphae]GAP71611.1 hypothetical protein SAMD00024442_15_15 [Candidatus Symbiothrix dinenymphae]
MDKKELVFGEKNFILLAAAIVVIIVGFVLMAGGQTIEGAGRFDPSIFSFRRITVAPIVTLLGFALVVYAILFKEKE